MSIVESNQRIEVDFPSVDDVLQTVSGSEVDHEFLEMELGPGLDYYVRRIDRLMLAGDRVLDAGCGVGQWSAALAQRFRHVEAIDLKENRLEVARYLSQHHRIDNMTVRCGSIDDLPYEDTSFDAVFCYGVIMFTPIQQVLAEFHRVMKPGGRVYVCLNAGGWSRYLIDERSKTHPAVADVGRMTLYKTYWHRAINAGFAESLQSGAGQQLVMPKLILRSVLAWARLSRINPDKLATVLLKSSPQGRLLYESVKQDCGPDLVKRLMVDVIACLKGGDVREGFGPERAYNPDDINDLVAGAGFSEFDWASEGDLVYDWQQPACKPRYDGYFNNRLSVWEFQAAKPDWQAIPVSADFHIRRADDAASHPIFFDQTAQPRVSNTTQLSYPPELFAFAQRLAKDSGGTNYLAALARQICRDAEDDTGRACCIIRFVQKALFRDPVCQPLEQGGSVPDAATILFCARGRCGHAAELVSTLAQVVGIESRITQLPQHVIAELSIEGRWVIADADAFKNGVVPLNRDDRLLSMKDLKDNPYQIDRFSSTGLYIRPNSSYTQGVFGTQVRGYVDALEPDDRGFVSRLYSEESIGFPPSLPEILRFELADDDRFELEWAESIVREGELRGYRVRVGTTSCGWTYQALPNDESLLNETLDNVLSVETLETSVCGTVPKGTGELFASITPFSSRIDLEPETFFRPSEEARCER